jgi:hypothetical protein
MWESSRRKTLPHSLTFSAETGSNVNKTQSGNTVFMVPGLVGSSDLKPNASRRDVAVVLNLLPIVSLPRRLEPSSDGDVTISSESSIALLDSFGGANDHEKRRCKLGSVVGLGGDPRPKSVEKLGFCEKEARRLGGGRGTGPGCAEGVSP